MSILNTKVIGNKIAEARKKANISQAQLAEQLFISSQAVGKWERGESMPDIITFNRLAEILGVDLNYFSEKMPTESKDKADYSSDNQHAELTSKQPKKNLSWDMSKWNWQDADFSGLKNLNEKFSSSNMQRCLFVGSNLSGLLLKSNNVESCDFSDSDISKSQIQRSNLSKDKFKNCLLKEAEFYESNISECDFSEANLTEVTFKSCGFEKNIVTNAKWDRTSFIASGIDNMVFEGLLENCSFEMCSFSRTTFQNATLINTFFKSGRLKRIKFIDCKADKMTYEFLKNGKADLTGITLITE